jgi:chromosome segregation ATPase
MDEMEIKALREECEELRAVVQMYQRRTTQWDVLGKMQQQQHEKFANRITELLEENSGLRLEVEKYRAIEGLDEQQRATKIDDLRNRVKLLVNQNKEQQHKLIRLKQQHENLTKALQTIHDTAADFASCEDFWAS